MSAAGRQGDLAHEWTLSVATHDPVDLEDPGVGWISLDRKLAAALTKVSFGEPGRQLASSAAMSEGRIARGRVPLASVFKHYASGHSAELMHDINHLQKIVFRGESQRAFITSGLWY